jgi:hypothetical protein
MAISSKVQALLTTDLKRPDRCGRWCAGAWFMCAFLHVLVRVGWSPVNGASVGLGTSTVNSFDFHFETFEGHSGFTRWTFAQLDVFRSPFQKVQEE